MMYKYLPRAVGCWDDYSKEDYMREFGDDIRHFFSFEDIRELVDDNNWQEVFEKWEFSQNYKYNPSEFTAEVLAFFLYTFTDIDFMRYMDNPKRFSFWDENLVEV